MDSPRIHLINLDRNLDRLQRFQQRNGHLGLVTRVAGADGALVDREQMVASGLLADGFHIGAGSLGCALSHVKLWQMAVRENRAVTVLEDDVIAIHNFAAASARVLADLPADWDLVKWGASLNLTAWIDVGVARTKLHAPWGMLDHDEEARCAFQAGVAGAAPAPMLYSLGLYAYAISPRGARAALEHCLPLRARTLETLDGGAPIEARGIDATLCSAFPRMRAFMCLPALVAHADGGESVRMQLDQSTSVP